MTDNPQGVRAAHPGSANDLLSVQQQLIENIARGEPLARSLTLICQQLEQTVGDDAICASILLLEGEALRHGAAPSLPEAYIEAIDGLVIGPSVGSCGTAVYRKQQIIASDIETDPRWSNFRNVALEHGLHACWSTPILSSSNQVLGSFAVYHRIARDPTNTEMAVAAFFTHLASLAIEKDQTCIRERDLASELRASHESFERLVSLLPDLGAVIDVSGRFVKVFGQAEGFDIPDSATLVGRSIYDTMSNRTAEKISAAIQRALTSGEAQFVEDDYEENGQRKFYESYIQQLNHYLPERPDERHCYWLVRDITARKQAELEVRQLAYYDALTGLANRSLLLDRVEMTIRKAGRNQQYTALLYFDLDNFKQINDVMGHHIGDDLLKHIGARLSASMRSSDTLARIGGDEFVVLLDTLFDSPQLAAKAATKVAEGLLESFSSRFSLSNDSEQQISSSIGISLLGGEANTSNEVLRRADIAMYHAKGQGGKCYAFFDERLQAETERSFQIKVDLEKALVAGDIVAHYQPQFDSQGHLRGVEALARWRRPGRDFVSPEVFIPVAEKAGLIDDIQEAVLVDACRLYRRIRKTRPDDDFCIAINISASQLMSQVDSKLVAVCERFSVAPSVFKIEITESMLMDNIQQGMEQMHALKELGFQLSIDDFGTGYSSLAYLSTFPIDEIKIDKSFVEIGTPACNHVIDAIVSLGDSFGYTVVAEGVETRGQRDNLVQRGVEFMQGYYFAKPMSVDSLLDWLSVQDNEVVCNISGAFK